MVMSLFLRAKRALGTREGLLFLALVVGAIVIRLPLMRFTGYYGDLSTYLRWGDIVNQHFTAIYTSTTSVTNIGGGQGGGNFGGGNFGGNGNGGFPGRGGGGGNFGGFMSGAINYPPGTPYLFGAIVYLYTRFLEPSFHTSLTTLVQTVGAGPFIAKVPILLADIAALIFFYVQARKRHSERFALVVAASYALSPALLYNGVIWGQTDGFVSFPLIIAIFALVSESYILGGVSLALAIVIKPQPIIFVPLIAIFLYRWADRRGFVKFSVAGLVTVLIFLIPVLVPHFQLGDMIKNIQSESYNDTSLLTSNAFNFWWLMGYSQDALGTSVLGVKASLVGEILFLGVTVLCCAQIWRRREPITLFLAMAVQIYGFFMFMGGQHERYLFLFIPLILASIILVRREEAQPLIALYILGTALCFLNMFVGVGGGNFGGGQAIPFVNSEGLKSFLSAGFTSFSMLIALGNLITFGYMVYIFLSKRFAPLPQPAAEEAPVADAALALQQ